jgi:hypothetical protein
MGVRFFQNFKIEKVYRSPLREFGGTGALRTTKCSKRQTLFFLIFKLKN